MTDRLEELIWMELDGEMSAEEARELAELRSGSADAAGVDRALESEVRELAAELSRVEDVAAPPQLKQRVLAAIAPDRPAAIEPPGSRKQAAAPLAFPKAAAGGWGVWRRWGYLAAGLLIAGVAIFQLAPGGPGSESASDLTGTVAPVPVPMPESGAAPAPDGMPGAAMPDFVRLTRRDGRLLAALTPGVGDAVFVFRAPGLEVEQVEFDGGARGTWEAAADQITLRVAGPGRVEARLLVARPEQPVRFSASGGDLESFEKEFFLYQLSES